MRPMSRGTTGTGAARPMSGMATGMARPNSGRLATARLRTGAPSGPGTQAGQGLALNMNINIQDRPVTGQGMVGIKSNQNNTNRIVEDNAYYIGLLRKKINDITQETKRLQILYDNNIKDTSLLSNLEKKYNTLLQTKESLEGVLADYNLALDKVRTSTDPDDVLEHTKTLSNKNKLTSNELDRIFTLRKERELEIIRIEDLILSFHNNIQKRINTLEPNKLHIYNDLNTKYTEYKEIISNTEFKLNEVNNKIDNYENNNKNNIYRNEYLSLDKTYHMLRQECESLKIELDIAENSGSAPKEGRYKSILIYHIVYIS